ncbi:para-aminobenzoate synthetase/4-amino-4-deoxychorismate lyase [Peribacillus deserti]|uniref:Para-aminobenzoate synthetase/4-amino-4-deoxychorismate lyase n=1 Tax=Peribacillus deserti TaxID=673318 RepID=A0ABS2QD02_9BACI|nr:aminodeoxychorismate synthase component I [Peribacillus deserti]MBM7691036.1 para-aminobenzoate synthetase/4-amino-4-deoxychorismate lyase [Peribacillus deserti]
MDKSKKVPYLHFEFTDSGGQKKPLAFSSPIEIIETNQIEDVIDKLQAVEKYVKEGKYAAGYVSYEAAPAFESSLRVHPHPSMPLLWFGIFESPSSVIENEETGEFQISEWTAEFTEDDYRNGFERIQTEIEEGNTYQVNYTMRLKAHFEGNDYAFYKRLSRAQSANYSAYLNIGSHRILSASPELFFRLQEGHITARPMKGTIQRGKTPAEDREHAKWLFESEKNRSENLMIVDLLRNDLGEIAKTGTVQVPELFQIEKYPTVWQMTSQITCELLPELGISDIFKALFPCGSITGAPKISTMNIISEVENSPREVYCGAVGYITPKGEAIFNVPIRTVLIDNKTGGAQYGVGGGITWDSTLKDEYHEAFVKARLLTENHQSFQLLESLRLENGLYELLEQHITRILESAEYFNYEADEKGIRKILSDFASRHNSGVLKVRLLLSRSGELFIEGAEIGGNPESISVKLANRAINIENPFVYHKTTRREMYDAFRSQNSGVFDVLLWNAHGELTEFTLGNLVLKVNGELLTPPISSGLLGGTFRAKLLAEGTIKQQVLTKGHLNSADEIWFINSVRGWIKAELC